MIVVFDLGNSRLKGAIYTDEKGLYSRASFSFPALSHSPSSKDALREWLRQNFSEKKTIEKVIISSVAPSKTPVLLEVCEDFFGFEKVKRFTPLSTSIELCCDCPSEVGEDRAAAFLGARAFFIHEGNFLVFDCGTATTAGFVNQHNQFTGGAILPGMGLALEALTMKAENLKALNVPLIKPPKALGTNTIDNIQSGLYYSTLGFMKEIKQEVLSLYGASQVIGTGGVSALFQEDGIFDFHNPDLVLWGLAAFWKESE